MSPRWESQRDVMPRDPKSYGEWMAARWNGVSFDADRSRLATALAMAFAAGQQSRTAPPPISERDSLSSSPVPPQ